MTVSLTVTTPQLKISMESQREGLNLFRMTLLMGWTHGMFECSRKSRRE
jgi:hypothetical protein